MKFKKKSSTTAQRNGAKEEEKKGGIWINIYKKFKSNEINVGNVLHLFFVCCCCFLSFFFSLSLIYITDPLFAY